MKLIKELIGKKKRVKFSYKAEPGSKVELMGDFNNWQENPIELKEVNPGEYEVVVAFKRLGTYQFKYQVNGEWVEEMEIMPPACGTVPTPFGSRNYFFDLTS